jgi:hypothetical protein
MIEFLHRRSALDPDQRASIATQLANIMSMRVGIALDRPPEAILAYLAQAYHQRQEHTAAQGSPDPSETSDR